MDGSLTMDEEQNKASMAKMFVSDRAFKVMADAVYIFGGYGYCKEYKVERY